ncbi:hypothetical protein QOZ80_8BG0664500 [Eleusine coracana subsp. coracana]|nr:hypothetical protein QOZ80_8BG0664500 [Eleusine coracana subsp. coracana]
MCHTAKHDPKHAIPDRKWQMFSIKVAELKDIDNDFKWPLQVYGFIAVRDSIDPRRNLLFQRDRSNCQTITEEEPFLLLTGPSRAVVVIDPVSFEVQLKVKGKTEHSEDKTLVVDAFASQHAIAYMTHPVRPFTIDVDGVHCKLELTQALLEQSVEATIMVEVHDGSWPEASPARVTACTDSVPDWDILLIDSGNETPTFSRSGLIKLSRRVVSVELSGQLRINVEAK